jgi:recombinational DNA repair ATPase RecF
LCGELVRTLRSRAIRDRMRGRCNNGPTRQRLELRRRPNRRCNRGRSGPRRYLFALLVDQHRPLHRHGHRMCNRASDDRP